jgi:hypothetical protein
MLVVTAYGGLFAGLQVDARQRVARIYTPANHEVSLAD